MNTNNTSIEFPEMITAKDVAKILNIGYTKALEMLKYKVIRSVKLGNSYRTTPQAVDEWLKANMN